MGGQALPAHGLRSGRDHDEKEVSRTGSAALALALVLAGLSGARGLGGRGGSRRAVDS